MKNILLLFALQFIFTSICLSQSTITNSIGQKFILIKPGSFLMGPDNSNLNELSTIHFKTTLTNSFYMQTTEVTQGQWFEIMGTKPWMYEGQGKKGKEYAATCISWNAAKKFIKKLNRREKTKKYRLPYEAEWEYSCRAGDTSKYWFGNKKTLGEYAWFGANSSVKGEKYHYKKVGLKKPNNWGLYDMNGNVWEWCEDWYGFLKPNSIDPKGSVVGYKKINRGGDWESDFFNLRRRGFDKPEWGSECYSIGFRLVIDNSVKTVKKVKVNRETHRKEKKSFKFLHGNINSIGQKFIYIKLIMGRYKTKFNRKHKVTLSTGFYIENLNDVAWFKNYKFGDYKKKFSIHKVGKKKPNKWGLFDMLGNVGEWCNDWHYYYPEKHVIDPQGAPESPDGDCCKIYRGGNYDDSSKYISYTIRGYSSPNDKSPKIGFRIAISE